MIDQIRHNTQNIAPKLHHYCGPLSLHVMHFKDLCTLNILMIMLVCLGPSQAEVSPSSIRKAITEKDLDNEMFQEGFQKGTTSENLGLNISSETLKTEITRTKEILNLEVVDVSSQIPKFTTKILTDEFLKEGSEPLTVGMKYLSNKILIDSLAKYLIYMFIKT